MQVSPVLPCCFVIHPDVSAEDTILAENPSNETKWTAVQPGSHGVKLEVKGALPIKFVPDGELEVDYISVGGSYCLPQLLNTRTSYDL